MTASKDRRRSKRIKHRMVVRFEVGGVSQRGVILDLSEVGLFVQSDRILSLGSELSLTVGSGKQVVSVQGTVVWSLSKRIDDGVECPGGMGISLAAASAEYLQLVHRLRSQAAEAHRPSEERFDVYHRVSFESQGAFLTEYIQNLSRGGMYLATETHLKPNTPIRAKLEIPGVPDPIEVTGRIAYLMSAQKALEVGRAPGVGVQFVDLVPEAKAAIEQYLHRLEVHRCTPERRQVKEIPFSGSLGHYLVPEILLDLHRKRATGLLRLEFRELKTSVYLKQGQPIFVESNGRTDKLGYYLVQKEKISLDAWEASMREVGESDLRYGEVLIKNGWIDGAALAEALIEHHEEKLIHTFPWFDGKFMFSTVTEWPASISIFPLRTFHILFSGIRRWYDPPLIRSWMGLAPESRIRRVSSPSADAPIPPRVLRLLRLIAESRSLLEISAEFKESVDLLLPDIFALILAGWAALDFAQPTKETAARVSRKQAAAPALSEQAMETLKRRIREDHKRLRSLDFYEILGVRPTANEAELMRAYVACTAPYSSTLIENLEDPEACEQAAQIASWIRLAYDTLRDPGLRQIYARRGSKPSGAGRDSQIDIERYLLRGVQTLEQGKVKEAVRLLEAALKQYPDDSSLRGYLAWALFTKDPKEHLQRASELLEDAIQHEPADPHLRYFRGEIFAYLGNWSRAEKSYAQAVRLHPNFIKAAAAHERARDRRIAQERPARVRG